VEETEVFAACALGQGGLGAMRSFGVQCMHFAPCLFHTRSTLLFHA
jgi:hypothetical protein